MPLRDVALAQAGHRRVDGDDQRGVAACCARSIAAGRDVAAADEVELIPRRPLGAALRRLPACSPESVDRV